MTSTPIRPRNLALTCGFALAGLAGQTAASGFALIEQSVPNMGTAYAGGSAMAEDASVVFFNPAGMSLLGRNEVSAGLHYVVPGADFSNRGSYVNPALTGGVPVPGSLPGANDDGGKSALVPTLFWVHGLNERTTFGLGINAPFGQATEYKEDWVGKYHAIESEVKTININPSLAYQVNDRLSLGLGISAQYLEAKLTNAVDFGTVCAGSPASAPFCGAFGVAPLSTDGAADVEGDSWGWGFNLGLAYQMTDATRLGAAYRSQISHDLDGDAKFTVPANFQALLGAAGSSAFQNTSASAGIDLPQTLSLSLLHQVNPQWTVMGDLTWTGWSSFEELKIEYDNPAQPDTVQPENWNDTWRVAAGASYRHNPTWTFRGGLAYDQTPVPNKEDRTPRIPGNSRTWLALGLGYNFSDTISLDVGYAHLFVADTKIDNTDEATGHQLVGDYDNTVDILSAQLNWRY